MDARAAVARNEKPGGLEARPRLAKIYPIKVWFLIPPAGQISIIHCTIKSMSPRAQCLRAPGRIGRRPWDFCSRDRFFLTPTGWRDRMQEFGAVASRLDHSIQLLDRLL
jgi:hypothetical protein